MEITPFDVADATQTEQLFRVQQAVHAADRPDTPAPLWEEFLAAVRQGPAEARTERLVARLDGEVVGVASLRLPVFDNLHLAQMAIEVAPAHRRRGVGRALFERVRERAREEQRRTLGGWASRAVPGGPARSEAGARFLTALGFSPALEGLGRRIDLTAIDEATEQRLLDECLAYATDYEVIGWSGLTPDELASGAARVVNRLNTDAPSGEIELDATTMDTDRLHALERTSLERHLHLVGVAARHRDTGEVAAITKIEVRPVGDHGWVALTIADPKHRGHRLGTIVKIESHRLVRRAFPDLRYVYTGNAETNAPMAAINERIGFVVFEAGALYQLTL